MASEQKSVLKSDLSLKVNIDCSRNLSLSLSLSLIEPRCLYTKLVQTHYDSAFWVLDDLITSLAICGQ